MEGGSVKIPMIKLDIIGTYKSGGGGGSPNPEFPTIFCWKCVEFKHINLSLNVPTTGGRGGVEILPSSAQLQLRLRWF